VLLTNVHNNVVNVFYLHFNVFKLLPTIIRLCFRLSGSVFSLCKNPTLSSSASPSWSSSSLSLKSVHQLSPLVVSNLFVWPWRNASSPCSRTCGLHALECPSCSSRAGSPHSSHLYWESAWSRARQPPSRRPWICRRSSRDFRFRRPRSCRRRWRGACRTIRWRDSATDSTRRTAAARRTARPDAPNPRPGTAARGSRRPCSLTPSTSTDYPSSANRRRPAESNRDEGSDEPRDRGSRSRTVGPWKIEWRGTDRQTNVLAGLLVKSSYVSWWILSDVDQHRWSFTIILTSTCSQTTNVTSPRFTSSTEDKKLSCRRKTARCRASCDWIF